MTRKSILIIASFAVVRLYAQDPQSKTVPIMADYVSENSRALADGNSIKNSQVGRYFRDSAGRTRSETGAKVVISNPVSQATYILDTAQKTVMKVDHSQLGATTADRGSVTVEARLTPSPAGGVVPTDRALGNAGVSTNATKRESIGDRVIEGFTCEGQRFTSTIPANSPLGNTGPIQLKSEVWFSGKLQLPLLAISDNPLAGTSIQRYTNIQAGIEPDATLFRVPDGYTSVSR